MPGAEPVTRDLADVLGEAILSGMPPAEGEGQDHVAIVRRTAEAEAEAGRLLRQSVAAARAAGHSWSTLGRELGMTRQAAQQRFGDRADRDEATGGEGEERWLGPVTAFDEMAELDLAGRQGWRTVDAAMFRHRMRRTGTQWEHKRIVWGPLRRWEAAGWEGVRAFPWIYLVRDTGRPAEAPDAAVDPHTM